MKINNCTLKSITSKSDRFGISFDVDDKEMADSFKDFIALRGKIGVLDFEIDHDAMAQKADMITPGQQAKLHMKYKEMAEHTGHTLDECKNILLEERWGKELVPNTKKLSKEGASNFIEFIINYFAANDIAFKPEPGNHDIVSASIRQKMCMICGSKEATGGKIEGKIFYVCQKHWDEITAGTNAFLDKYHLKDYFYGIEGK